MWLQVRPAAEVALPGQQLPVSLAGVPSPFDSLVPALALAEMLVAGVVDALGDQPRERIARYDRLWRDDGFEYTPS